MSIRLIVSLFIAYCLIAVSFTALGWAWLVELNPSLPLVPFACFLMALLSAGYAGDKWRDLDGK
jgi:hypothetical protein